MISLSCVHLSYTIIVLIFVTSLCKEVKTAKAIQSQCDNLALTLNISRQWRLDVYFSFHKCILFELFDEE